MCRLMYLCSNKIPSCVRLIEVESPVWCLVWCQLSQVKNIITFATRLQDDRSVWTNISH